MAELGITIMTAVGVTWGEEKSWVLGDGMEEGAGEGKGQSVFNKHLLPYQPSWPGLAGSWSHFHGVAKGGLGGGGQVQGESYQSTQKRMYSPSP